MVNSCFKLSSRRMFTMPCTEQKTGTVIPPVLKWQHRFLHKCSIPSSTTRKVKSIHHFTWKFLHTCFVCCHPVTDFKFSLHVYKLCIRTHSWTIQNSLCTCVPIFLWVTMIQFNFSNPPSAKPVHPTYPNLFSPSEISVYYKQSYNSQFLLFTNCG